MTVTTYKLTIENSQAGKKLLQQIKKSTAVSSLKVERLKKDLKARSAKILKNIEAGEDQRLGKLMDKVRTGKRASSKSVMAVLNKK
jgi:hypothetical protein